MVKEFRDFVMRGNLVELAVAFVIGVVFAALVGSFIASFVMPFISMIIGEPDFSGLTFTVNGAVFAYGSFITVAITGITRSFTNELMSAANASPITNATASSTRLPRMRKSRNSLTMEGACLSVS